MSDDKEITEPKVKIKVSGTIAMTIEVDPSHFDLVSDFGGRIPTKKEMADKYNDFMIEDCTLLWEDGEISDVKVEIVNE